MKVFLSSIKNEFLKQKRGFTWIIVLLLSLGTSFLAFVDVYLRYDYLTKKQSLLNTWEILLLENHLSALWFITFPLAVTTICSLLYYVDYKDGGLKYTLTLPISKNKLYFSKWVTVVIFSIFMIILNISGLILAGKILNFPDSLDIHLFLKYGICQFIALLGVISLQLWLSSRTNNIIVSLAQGFVGIIASLFLAQSQFIAKLIPYAHILYSIPLKGENNSIAIQGGITFGLLFLFIGMVHFKRKDILD
jgi:hypothetical protein